MKQSKSKTDSPRDRAVRAMRRRQRLAAGRDQDDPRPGNPRRRRRKMRRQELPSVPDGLPVRGFPELRPGKKGEGADW